jgi:hypothetical protein
MSVSERLRHAAARLSDYLQVMNHPNLKHLVTQKNIEADGGPCFDFGDSFQDIAQAIRIGPHRVIASR